MPKRPILHVIVFCFIVISAAFTGITFYSFAQKAKKQEAYRTLSSLSSLKLDRIKKRFQDKHYDADYISKSVYLNKRLSDLRWSASNETLADLNEFVHSFVKRSDYTDVVFAYKGIAESLLDNTPAVLLPADKEFIIKCELSKQSEILKILRLSNGRILLNSYIPIFSKSTGQFIGVLILRTDPTIEIFPLITSKHEGSGSAEAFIVTQDGDNIVYLNDLKFQQNKSVQLRLPLSTENLAAAMAIKGHSGIFEGKDYRGEPVLADLRAIPGMPWFLVSKIDKSEVYEPVRKSALMISAVAITIILLFGMLLRMHWNNVKLKFIKHHLDVETQKNKLEEQLLQAQTLARLGSWELDLERNELSWSDEVYKIFGLQPQEFAATYEAFLEHVHPDDRDAVNTAYTSSIQDERESYEIEHRIIQKNGELRYVHEKCQHHRNSKGKVISSVGMVQDITERKVTQLNLEAALKELQRSNKDLEQFAYTASHDLREPIRMVKSYAQLLEYKSENLSSDAKTYMNFINEGAGRMQNLVDGLLEISRLATKPLEYEDVDCNIILNEVLQDLQINIAETCAKINFENLPMIKANGLQIRMLLQNLIHNALRFRGDTTPVIYIRCELKDKYWMFSVEDNGIGIDPEYFDKIFIMFQRLHNRDKYPGTGMGLALCKKIVEKHGGHIFVDSVPGKGSRFSFFIPA